MLPSHGVSSGKKTYSLDLREKVVATVDEGELSLRAIAGIFKVSFTWVKKILRQRREHGSIQGNRI